MAWHFQGTYVENCNCNMVCPCTTSGGALPADYDRCLVVASFHIASGEVEGVDVRDRKVVMLWDTPQMMLEGKWRVGIFIDDAASRQQAEKLAAVFSGKLGGPMAGVARLFGDFLGTETAPIDFVDDGHKHRVRVGDAVEIETEDFVSPRSKTGEVTKLVGLGHAVSSTLTVARATRARANAFGLEFSNDGKNGHSASFSWSA